MMCVLDYLLLCVLFMSGNVLTSGPKEDANMSSCIEKERQALLDLKASLNVWPQMLYSWGSQEDKDCCKWMSVGCNKDTGRVTELRLGDALEYDITFHRIHFTGKFSLSLHALDQLQYLNLNNIDFQSSPLPLQERPTFSGDTFSGDRPAVAAIGRSASNIFPSR
ncbi:putative non-specific serine/threonine protein kinase [Helianthus anomalus]